MSINTVCSDQVTEKFEELIETVGERMGRNGCQLLRYQELPRLSYYLYRKKVICIYIR